MGSNSAQNQDIFVLSMLEEKHNGYYVEIGAGHYKDRNNTLLLEERYNWKGVGLDVDKSVVEEYQNHRRNECIRGDGSVFNFDKYFEEHNYPHQIDFLQIDVDHTPENIALLTLLNMPLSRYRFSVICFEHDDLMSWKYERIKNLSREILTMYGYQLVMREASEDYWVDPLQVPIAIWQRFVGQHYRHSDYHNL